MAKHFMTSSIEFLGLGWRCLHHAMARGNRREGIYWDGRHRSKFLGYLADAVLGSCALS
jgi:hypothetical protein